MGGSESPRNRRVGEHWSAQNPVPTIHRFLERMEQDKEARKAHEEELDAQEKARVTEKKDAKPEAIPHRPRKSKGKTRVVTDPTTGRDIEVEDQDSDSMDAVKNAKVDVGSYSPSRQPSS